MRAKTRAVSIIFSCREARGVNQFNPKIMLGKTTNYFEGVLHVQQSSVQLWIGPARCARSPSGFDPESTIFRVDPVRARNVRTGLARNSTLSGLIPDGSRVRVRPAQGPMYHHSISCKQNAWCRFVIQNVSPDTLLQCCSEVETKNAIHASVSCVSIKVLTDSRRR